MRESQRQEIERFVRGALGCRCPEGVFRQAELESVTEPGGTGLMTRLVIGHKLLIYVAVLATPGQVARQLTALASHGRHERDEQGLNRFRLVLVSYGGTVMETGVREALDAMLEGDDRTQVHVVPRSALPTALLPGSTHPGPTGHAASAAP